MSRIATLSIIALPIVIASASLAAPPPAATAKADEAPLALSCKKEAQDATWAAYILTFNGHSPAETLPLLGKALAADPSCVVAQFLSASWSPSADSQKKIDDAVAAAAKLPEAERTWILQMDAMRKGDTGLAMKLAQKFAELAPKSWVPQVALAMAQRQLGRFEETLVAAKKATELGPKVGATWNQLAYANMLLHKNDDAVAALKKYTEVAPTEPNAHDTLGDALLAAGKLDEAEAAFTKAIDVSSGKFAVSYNGAAGVHFIKGDFDGGRALVAKWRAAELDPQAKLDADFWNAWSFVAQGKATEAMAALDSVEKEAPKVPALYAVADAPLTRAEALYELDKYADAQKALVASEKVDASKLAPAFQRTLRMRRAALAVEIAAKSGKPADAEKALAAVDAEAKGDPNDPMLQDRARVARGEVALAKKDAKAAVAALKDCQKEMTYCQWRLAVAQDAAGDAKGAQATRDAIQKEAFRDIWYAYARSKAAAKK